MSTINTYSDIDRRDTLGAKFEEIDKTIYVEEVSLTAANIIAMNATPVTVIEAKGAGTVIEVVGCVFVFDYGTTQFTGGGAFRLAEETSGTALTEDFSAGIIQAAADSITTVDRATAETTLVANKAVQITNDTAAFAAGDGVARLKIAYRVHNTGL